MNTHNSFGRKNAFTIVFLLTLISLPSVNANCEKLLEEAKKKGASTLIVAFDGLGTAELNMGVLERTFAKTAIERCGEERVIAEDFYYSKKGAKKAVACAVSFKKAFGRDFELNVVGHSFGAGKGVFNFFKEAKGKGLVAANAITFDPRGYDYKYARPSKNEVRNFVNIYQQIPLAGRTVKGADFEKNVTGKASHVGLPRGFSDLALSQMVGELACAR